MKQKKSGITQEWCEDFKREATINVSPERITEVSNIMLKYHSYFIAVANNYLKSLEDANDVVSEVKLKLLEAKNGKGLLFDNNIGSGKTYVVSAIRNMCFNISHEYKPVVVPIEPYDDTTNIISEIPTGIQNLLEEETNNNLNTIIHKHLNNLKPEDRYILECLFGFNGAIKSEKELSLELGISVPGVSLRKNRLLKRLSKLNELDDYYHNDYCDRCYDHYYESGTKMSKSYK